jgi:prepilin-type N-terminal cleavage/methylation domain-containing protein
MRPTIMNSRRTPISRFNSSSVRGFTLIEILVVAALIALMTALVAPSLKGLFGVAGRRGGASLLGGALEQARLAAIEKGVPSYVVFPDGIDSSDASASAFVVLRQRTAQERLANTNDTNPVAISRWFRLPQGVFFDPQSIKSADAIKSTNFNRLPRLGDFDITNQLVIEFDRFGRVKGNQNQLISIRVGEGGFNGGTVTFRPSTNDYYLVTVYPMTGRVKVADNILKAP